MGFIAWILLGLLAGSCYYLLPNYHHGPLLLTCLKLGIIGALTGGIISNLALHEPLGRFSLISLNLIWFAALASVYLGDQLRLFIPKLLIFSSFFSLTLRKLFNPSRLLFSKKILISNIQLSESA